MNSIQILFDLCVGSCSRKVRIPTGLEFLAARKLHASANRALQVPLTKFEEVIPSEDPSNFRLSRQIKKHERSLFP